MEDPDFDCLFRFVHIVCYFCCKRTARRLEERICQRKRSDTDGVRAFKEPICPLLYIMFQFLSTVLSLS
jgi:hypothetical protein